MSGIDFDYLPVTTITAVVTIEGKVNIHHIFPLLKITHLNIPKPERIKQKIKIPYPGFPGAILSATHQGITRGIVRSTRGYFKNSIGVDISVNSKNVNIKLSESTIQMCGPKSEAMVKEATDRMISCLRDAQNILEHIREDKDVSRITFDWVKENTKEEEIYVVVGTNTIADPLKIIFTKDGPQYYYYSEDTGYHNVEKITTICIPKEYEVGYPSHIDADIATFLIELAPDFIQHDTYCTNLDWIFNITEDIIKGSFNYNIKLAMDNYNYDLGFDVDRWKLCQKINGRNGFMARYDNLVDHCVTITLIYEIPPHLKDKISNNQEYPKLSFLVYKSGLVTQSGSCREINETAYNLFNRTINEIKDEIYIPRPSRVIKYFPYPHSKIK